VTEKSGKVEKDKLKGNSCLANLQLGKICSLILSSARPFIIKKLDV
jgi:hypothetical protein